MRKAVLLSIKPKFARKIYLGIKKVELRKSRPNIKSGDTVIIYETAPIRAVTGVFIIRDILEYKDCCDLYSHLYGLEDRNNTGLSYYEYRNYFEGANKAVALLIEQAKKADIFIPLSRLRIMIDGFNPPQSYYYVDDVQAEAILKMMNI